MMDLVIAVSLSLGAFGVVIFGLAYWQAFGRIR